MQVVAVHAAGGREAGVKVVGHTLNPADGDVAGQQLVQLIGQLPTVNLTGRIEVGHHHAGMDAGIRAPCSCHDNFTTQQQRQGPLQARLHGVAVGLYLPPVVAGAVVAESYKISHCGCKVTKIICNFAP